MERRVGRRGLLPPAPLLELELLPCNIPRRANDREEILEDIGALELLVLMLLPCNRRASDARREATVEGEETLALMLLALMLPAIRAHAPE